MLLHQKFYEVGKRNMSGHSIAKAWYDPVYGARPLKRYVQRQLETKRGRVIHGRGITQATFRITQW